MIQPAFDAWFELSREIQERLLRHGEDVLRFNRVQNLVSRQNPEAEVLGLLEESVRAGKGLVEPGGRWLEVGSGGGYPGLVLAAMFPGIALLSVERRRGRAEFLERSVLRMGLSNVRVVAADVEELDEDGFDWMTAKAVASPLVLMEWGRRRLAPGGHLLVFQRQAVEIGAPDWVGERSWPIADGDGPDARWAHVLRWIG